MAYTAIEYIQSTGTQYIDTGYYPNSNTIIEMKITVVEMIQFGTLFGTDDCLKMQMFWDNLDTYSYYFGNSEERITYTFPSNAVIVRGEKENIYVDSVLYGTTETSTFESQYSLILFTGRLSSDGTVEIYCIPNIKIHYFKIFEDETILHDYIPVLDENNVACLYDKVTDTYLYNAGTGDFVAGSVIQNPIITIGTPSRTKISAVSGYDQATVTFQSDIALAEWEARATVAGQTPGHCVGLLVESGSALAENTEATVYVDDEELTSGDLEYTISIFGHGSNGYWSDGTYEGINLLDLSSDVIETYYASIENGVITFDTSYVNTEGGEVKVQTLTSEWSFTSQLLWTESTGLKTVNITKDSSFDWLQIATNGDVADGYILIDSSIMNDGETYTLTFTIESMTATTAVISGITLVKVV